MLLCCILVALCCIMPPTSGKIGFKKDQSLTRIDFPPKIGLHSSSSGIPQGHLRPLGLWAHHSMASHIIITYLKYICAEFSVQDGRGSLKARYQRWFLCQLPKSSLRHMYWILSQLCSGMLWRMFLPCQSGRRMISWRKSEYSNSNYPLPLAHHTILNPVIFIPRFGELDIHVVVKKDLLRKGPQKMKFRKFLREYQFEEWYLTTSLPQPMMSDLIVSRSSHGIDPPCLNPLIIYGPFTLGSQVLEVWTPEIFVGVWALDECWRDLLSFALSCWP